MKKILFKFLLVFVLTNQIFISCSKDENEDGGSNYETVTDNDGNIYKAVTIGTQTWMVEDLRVTQLNDGIPLDAESPYSAADLTTPAYNGPNPYLSEEYQLREGILYNYAAIKTGKLAPKGWHVPTDEDWNTLADYLGGSDVAGGKMKSNSTQWRTPNTGSTSESKLNFLPNRCQIETSGYSATIYASDVMSSWWSATYNSIDSVKYYYLWYSSSALREKKVYSNSRFKVICVKGDPDTNMVYYQVDTNGLTSDINNFVSQSIIDKMKSMGMPIYTGTTPPIISSSIKKSFLISPMVLKATNIADDYPVGQQFTDMLISFYGQNNQSLTLNYEYDSKEVGDGAGVFIVGEDNKFTIFAKTISEYDGDQAIVLHAFSGILTSSGLAQLYYANFVTKRIVNNTGYFMSAGSGRVFVDNDGLAAVQ